MRSTRRSIARAVARPSPRGDRMKRAIPLTPANLPVAPDSDDAGFGALKILRPACCRSRPWRSRHTSDGQWSGAPAAGARSMAAGAPSRSTTSSSAPRGARTSISTAWWRSVRRAMRRRMPPTRAVGSSSPRSATGASSSRSPEGLISGRSARSRPSDPPATQGVAAGLRWALIDLVVGSRPSSITSG